MRECGCQSNNCGCNIFAVIVSIIIGLITGFVFSIGLIPGAILFIIIALVFSVFSVGTVLFSAFVANVGKYTNSFYKCVCSYGKCVLIGAIGTFISTTVTITIGILIPILSAILVGISTVFFVFLVINVFSMIYCIIKNSCRHCEE